MDFPASSLSNMEAKVSSCIASFAFKFCNELEKHKTTVCSPLSAEMALALVALGCKDESRAEILKVFDIPDFDTFRSTFSHLTTSLGTIKGSTLNIANKVYVKKGMDIKPEIQKDAEEMFKSTIGQLDFNEKEAAADEINQWAAEATQNKIKDVISAECFNKYTHLVLVNAIYFQGKWNIPFKWEHTKYCSFRVNTTTKIRVPLMYMVRKLFKYGIQRDLKAKLLRMDYEGFETSMVFVLPNEIEGLSEVMQKLADGHNLMADIEALEDTLVDAIKIPRFKKEIKIDLKELLPKLGIQSIFNNETANIDMLTSDEKLQVSQAIQKAVIEVNEDGTEVSAFGYGILETQCAARPKSIFVADHPFLYILLAHNTPIFIGTYEGIEYTRVRKRPAALAVPAGPTDEPPVKTSERVR